MAIQLQQHRANITNRIIKTFSDDSEPLLALSAWFPSETTEDKQVGIEVERNRQLVSVDVHRNSEGTVNTFSKSSEKLYEPASYVEAYDFTEDQYYDVTFGKRNNPTQSQAFSMIEKTAKRLKTLKDKIQRAIEKQRSQALMTGRIQLTNGDDIDFRRKAASIPVLAGSKRWSETTATPLEDIESWIDFVRKEGNSKSRNFDLIMGMDTVALFRNNPKVKEFADLKDIKLFEIGTTRFDNVTGLNVQGRLMLRNATVTMWTYDDYYEENDGTKKEYIDGNKVVLLPNDFSGTTAFAGRPKIMRDLSNAEFPQYIQQTEGEFCLNNYLDPSKKAHWFEISSAPLAIPVSIDRVVTAQVF